MSKIKKIIFIILSIITIFQIVLQMNKSKAAEIGDINYLERAEKGFYSIQKWNGSQWIYVTYSITHYTDETGVKRVAYCMNPNLKGVGWISGEFAGYDVKMKELLSDQRLWRVYTNGYPYKTPSQLGVETEEDAYLATKMAAYSIIYSNTADDIRSLYRAGTDKVQGQSLEDIQRRGNKVIDAICHLVNLGYNGTETMQNNNILQIEKVGDFSEDLIDKNYYSQLCKINSKVECSNYIIESITNFPEGTKITNEKGEENKSFKGGDKFKINVPKNAILENIDGSINVVGTCKNYPIYYAECTKGDYQSYALCCDAYSNNIKISSDISIEANKSNLKIVKKDKDTKQSIEGVIFSVKYEDGTDIGLYETNEKGEIYIKNLKQGNVIIKEIETNENYKLNTDEIFVKLEYNENKTIEIENERKKGSIKIIKVDASDNSIRIQGAKFEIYDQNNKLINTLITDENGEAVIQDLPVNFKYTIKEVETAEEYILSEEPVTILLEENQIKNLTFRNEKKQVEKEEIKKETLPRTGSFDISNCLLGFSAIGIIINKKFLIK